MALDYGKDTWCADSRKPGRYASGPMNVALSQYRRLITPPGALRDDPLFGLDLAAEVGKVVSVGDELALASKVSAQLELDERVATTEVRITPSRVGALVTYELEISVYLQTGGSFVLVVAVSGVTVELRRVVTP